MGLGVTRSEAGLTWARSVYHGLSQPTRWLVRLRWRSGGPGARGAPFRWKWPAPRLCPVRRADAGPSRV